MYKALKVSPYPRVSRSLNLTCHKAIIMLATPSYKKQFKIVSNVFEDLFDSLEIVDYLYRVYLEACWKG